MTTKVNDVYEVDSQFLTGSLAHFTLTNADLSATAQATHDVNVQDTKDALAVWVADPTDGGLNNGDNELAYDTAVTDEAATLVPLNAHKAAVKRAVGIVEGRATLVVLGAVSSGDLRVAVENNGTWAADTLVAELNADWTGSTWTVAAFAY
jgi:hydrogenase maturation factor